MRSYSVTIGLTVEVVSNRESSEEVDQLITSKKEKLWERELPIFRLRDREEEGEPRQDKTKKEQKWTKNSRQRVRSQ